jgi:hypothetical protein
MKMAVFWVLVTCSLVQVYQRFGGPCCLHHQGDDRDVTEQVRNIHNMSFRHLGILLLQKTHIVNFSYLFPFCS